MGKKLVLVHSRQTPDEEHTHTTSDLINCSKYRSCFMDLSVCNYACVVVVTDLAEGCQARAPTGAHGPRFSPSRGKESRVPRPPNCSTA